MIDIKIHPLVTQSYYACCALEKCKPSPALTKASEKATDLLRELHDYFKELKNVNNND
jgi:hypothetical protein